MIKKTEGGKWAVYDKEGKKSFGEYDTEDEAKARLAQMHKFKKRNQVNILTAVNAANIKREGNRITIPNVVPIVDNVVMNGGLYPAEEIANSYQGLSDKIAPAGHPRDAQGNYISAASPEAVMSHYIGAWCQNARYQGGKVLVDVTINADQCAAQKDGKRLLERIEAAANGEDVEPIHVSTGLMLRKEKKQGQMNGRDYSWVAHDMDFDHVAILLDQPGAATPDDGVGMFVNADESEVEFVALENNAKDKRGFLTRLVNQITGGKSFGEIAEIIAEALRDKYPESWLYEIYADRLIFEQGETYYEVKYTLDGESVVFGGLPVEVKRVVTYERTDQMTEEVKQTAEAAMNAAKKTGEELAAMTAKIDTLLAQVNSLTECVTAIKAKEEAAVNEQRQAVKEHYGLSDAVVNSLSADVVLAMNAKIAKPAQRLAAGLAGNAKSEFADYDMNAEG